ncbi:phospholipase [uncultured Vagococcus sp.]|uniref:alpha/beta hydrolase n=1 Tax=uncultured Vagococcus sp. TaxID=189676 RepID=UPI0028D4947D|nr:phospholipase [uncultured Vagococcus sp.]
MQHFMSEKSPDELFVLLHGTGGNEFSLLFLTGELNPKASLISFIGNHLTGEQRRYFPLPTNGQLDQPSFNVAVDDFLEEWDKLELDYPQITFIGYSNGANLLQGILQKRPNIAQRVVLLHPQEFQLEFENEIGNCQVLLTTGANDPLVIPGDAMALSKRLRERFKEVELIITDGEHGVTDEEIFKVRQWYQGKINPVIE